MEQLSQMGHGVAVAELTETLIRGQNARIHIDRHPYASPNPTTGAALYALGKVPAGFQLYREASGDHEDEPIHNDNEREQLTLDEHFYSREGRHPGYNIIVNTRPEHVDKKRVSFEEIVRLAYPKPPVGANILYTVTYYNGPKSNPDGILTAGQTVKVKNEMVFNVKATDRS